MVCFSVVPLSLRSSFQKMAHEKRVAIRDDSAGKSVQHTIISGEGSGNHGRGERSKQRNEVGILRESIDDHEDRCETVNGWKMGDKIH